MKKVFHFLKLITMCSVCIMIGVGLSIHFLKHNKDLPAKKVSSGETSNVPKKETNIGTENNGIIEFRGIQTKLNFK